MRAESRSSSPKFLTSSETTDLIFKTLQNDVRLAAPLGLGKPNNLLNDIYRCARENPASRLKIFTALSLRVPSSKERLGKRFLEPFAQRQWGKNYPALRYYRDALKNEVPENIQVHEFYFQAGVALKSEHLQRHYQSVNYTHVTQDVLNAGINIIVQMVSAESRGHTRHYSLSCNPDVTLDLVDLYKRNNTPLLVVGVVHPALPFLRGDAEVEENFFDILVEEPIPAHELFALPRMPISIEDHLIGYYASRFVRDGGTLQIGIGSLADAVVSALCCRQKSNAVYREIQTLLPSESSGHTEKFDEGLYGLTEMLTDGYMHLRQAGILKRHVIDENSGAKTFVHGSFFLGSKDFYRWLREMPDAEAQGVRMTRVSKVNDLFDPREMLLRKQRVHARFFNTTMQMTLLGEAMSETLEDAKVVSGVGGQYNFVAMSKELQDARSILMLRSYRFDHKGRRISNILWNPGHVTIPRHLRDVVITEYGVADLRGKSDEECIKAMLAITDSEFQENLLKRAKASGKIEKSYVIPTPQRSNFPGTVKKLAQRDIFRKVSGPFPFGSDFSAEEERLAVALQALQEEKNFSVLKILRRLLRSGKKDGFQKELARMDLLRPKSLVDRIYQRLVLSFLHSTSA